MSGWLRPWMVYLLFVVVMVALILGISHATTEFIPRQLPTL